MTRPLYLADEVRARLAQFEVMRVALTRIADLCADGVVTLGQIEHLARKALAPRSERREGECRECHGTGEVRDFGSAIVSCPACAPAAPKAPERGATYTVGGADGITRTFDREPNREAGGDET